MIGLGFGALLIILSLRLPHSPVPDDPGPAVFPILAGIILILTGTVLIIQKPDVGKKDKPYFTKEEWIRFVKLLGGFILYFFLLWLFGFIPASLVTFFIVSTMFLEGKKVVIWKQILTTIVIIFIIFTCFQILLGMRLPQGILLRLDF
jgi:hypothetical protein